MNIMASFILKVVMDLFRRLIFFMVLLDLNVYKRDLETKCIEQDETILEL